MDHTSTPVSWYRGIANFSLNRFQDALRDFENANTHHPYHIHVLNNLGTCYEMNKNHSQAEKVYLKALNISPQFDKALVNLSAVYFNQGEYQKAYQMVLKCREGWDWRRETYIQKIEEKLNSELYN
jgi:tetratricopeptide (TPR) repeat protein